MSFGPKSRMYVHRHRVQLLQRVYRSQQNYDNSTSLNRFNRPCQQIWGECFKILENAHSIRVSQNFMRLCIIAVANICRSNEELERIVLVYIYFARLDLLLQVTHPLFPMTGKTLIIISTAKLYVFMKYLY